jgi:hypothetical protein
LVFQDLQVKQVSDYFYFVSAEQILRIHSKNCTECFLVLGILGPAYVAFFVQVYIACWFLSVFTLMSEQVGNVEQPTQKEASIGGLPDITQSGAVTDASIGGMVGEKQLHESPNQASMANTIQ